MDPYSLKDRTKINSAMGNPPVHPSSQKTAGWRNVSFATTWLCNINKVKETDMWQGQGNQNKL